MAYSVTLTELVAKVRARSNLEGMGTSSDPFISDAEIIDYVNQGVTKLHEVICNSTWAGNYFCTSWTFNTVDRKEEYSLPADFFRVQYVDFFVNGTAANGQAVSVYEYPVESRNVLQGSLVPYLYAWNFKSTVYYRLKGLNNSNQQIISFRPAPAGVYPVRVTYTYVAPRLAAPDDSVDVVNGWEEVIVLWAVTQCLLKAGPYEAIPVMQGQYMGEIDRVRGSAPKRDLQTAEKTHILDSYNDYSYGYGDDGGY